MEQSQLIDCAKFPLVFAISCHCFYVEVGPPDEVNMRCCSWLNMQLLSLDLRDASKQSTFPVRPVGYNKPWTPCSLSASSSALSTHATESATMTSSHWGQNTEASLPSRLKMSFWAERSVSMVEPSTCTLGWASTEPKHPPASPIGGPVSGSPTSSRYKTELCRTFAESGICKYGGKCQFAHGFDEMRDLNRHPRYKTEPCRTFHTIGFCPYGIRCHFVHNNEDDLGPGPARPGPGPQTPQTRRPPLLRQSFSFGGFPSAPPQPLEHSLPHPFLLVPSVSPPTSSDITDLLSHTFSEVGCVFEPAHELQSQFLPSPDSGCSLCGLSPVPSQNPCTLSEGCSLQQSQSPPCGPALRARSLSYTSLSDHEGGCGSSASSLSGSDSSGPDGSGRRLPIFSQLSVPDEGFSSEFCSGTSFFL
ncbi:mRNA decay activator protein ZFP36L1-like isoform X3 [Oncorhynchus keta]|uniref:mRNA decay activator protein ZFP36L1-like isoform X3 n=1 Tax=Oncorhynchus keta TaxID=8018 RepID=UPI0015FBD42B|nr:mRNA decay activator protein ZFP36L1-like isoform X3 [Oncorhynchus keta]